MIRRALELNVSCLVLCQAEISEELRTLPTKTCIISTPYDAFRAARLIFQSIPVGRICNTQAWSASIWTTGWIPCGIWCSGIATPATRFSTAVKRLWVS